MIKPQSLLLHGDLLHGSCPVCAGFHLLQTCSSRSSDLAVGSKCWSFFELSRWIFCFAKRENNFCILCSTCWVSQRNWKPGRERDYWIFKLCYKFEFGLHLAAVDLVSWIGHGFKKSYVDFCVVASGEIIC